MTVHIAFDNSYARLPGAFFSRVRPSSAVAPRLIRLNRPLAEALGLDPDALEAPEGVAVLSGQAVPPGADPIATAYAGHQFGGFSPQLGDGRAILLGEVIGRDGLRRDIQLKGSGRTPFSRSGDGRAALGPVLREYLVSEAMAALGIPTTRALAAVATGETVYRETELPGAVLARVASSHIRVGTFQFFAARGDTEAVRQLADHAIARHDPEAARAAAPYAAFLAGVVARQAALVARWMQVGFIHGVMNTDNMAVSGETIDYGPCAFVDSYDPATVFSSIDRGGRYAYRNQPGIAQWNLARLTECLLPLLGDTEDAGLERGREILAGFSPLFHAAHLDGFRRKLGLAQARDGDGALLQDLLDRMAAGRADFTLTFRRLGDAAADPARDQDVRDLFIDPTAYDGWAGSWRARLADEPGEGEARRAAMRAVNPALVPRNHRVEEAIAAAIERDDFAPFERLGAALARPYDEPADPALAEPPSFDTSGYRTFCGT
ncbi:protein adenylyltransferase SelO [Lichenibacterium ramalinae]|uniref:Protein nucleotidyltransferase YdiU n=1 Tax=Lichenibacterium ramalinae TaxID=2316527 RepID=A0A4Q2RER7_9HYPH|nr:YdiU family protein [Lichenibacterium ramalinae]RYB04699.1 YdiU family protein [Lichenibacterium ramalinae]